MNNQDDILKQKRNRLKIVFEYLKSAGISQRDIADQVDCNEDELSHLKSGKIKYIPDELLSKLHKAYNINPNYIRLRSDILLDMVGHKLEQFESFVDSWNTVKKGDHEYLHITMDQNFYNFLIATDRANIVSTHKTTLEFEINSLKESNNLPSCPNEFVIIPRNNFIDIVQEASQEQKQLSEVIDLFEHLEYLGNEKATT